MYAISQTLTFAVCRQHPEGLVHTFFIGTLVHNVQYSRKFASLLPSRSRNVQLGERKWIIFISIIKGIILAQVYSHIGFQDSFIFYAWWMQRVTSFWILFAVTRICRLNIFSSSVFEQMFKWVQNRKKWKGVTREQQLDMGEVDTFTYIINKG